MFGNAIMLLNINTDERNYSDLIWAETPDQTCPIYKCQHINGKQFQSHIHTDNESVQWKYLQSLEEKDEIECPLKTEAHNSSDKYVMRPFICHECNLPFDRASQLDYHYRSTHLGERSQLCEICGKGFFRKTDLRTHLNIHLGTNSCICEVCGRKFNHISNLIRHCRVHAGIKPYPCSICGKRFTQISSLARHKRIHERQEKKLDKDNIPNHGNIVKRKHYCKICGENFNFIFLLRQHEKSHLDSETVSTKKNYCIESSKSINLKNAEGSKDQLADNLTDIDEKIEVETRNKNIDRLSISELSMFQNCMKKEEDRIHVCEADKDSNVGSEKNKSKKINSIQDSTDVCRTENEKKVDVKVNLCYHKANDISVQGQDVQKLLYHESIFRNRIQNKSLNIREVCKINETQKCNAPMNVLTNVNDSSLHQNQEMISMNSENLCQELLNNLNNINAHEESTFRLIQTEAGEQFYECVINNLIEKPLCTQSLKIFDHKSDESISQNSRNLYTINKDAITDEFQHEQHLQNTSDIHNDLNCMQYGLQGDEKNFITNQSLLPSDSQVDFDKYVEANFEVFEKLNYEHNSERLLEFVEIVESTPKTTISKELSTPTSVQLEGEQFFELLQGSQTMNKSETDNLTQIDPIQRDISISPMDIKVQNLLISNNDDTQSEVNIHSKEITHVKEKRKKENDDSKDNKKEDNIRQRTKKSKILIIKFQCTVCNKSFSTSYNYKQHIGIHFADQQKFHCKQCKMTFAWKSTFNKHIANVHKPDGPQKFTCKMCPKLYNTLSQINEHVKRDHLKERDHVCSYCGKSFFKKYDLKIHNRIHTNEQPYVCRVCGKRFHHRSHIIRHERIHL